MTTHRDWADAMLAEPTDDLVRLAFADWLDERGEADRAAWVRLGVAHANTTATGLARVDLRMALDAALAACLPDYWQHIRYLSAVSDRGLVTLGVGSTTIAKRLGGLRWLPRALADGWVGTVSVWADPDAPRLVETVLAAWRKQAQGAALAFVVDRQRTAAELVALLNLPKLYELKAVPPGLLTPEALALLAAHPGLRKLGLGAGPADRDRLDAVCDAAARAPRLRELTLATYVAGPHWLRPAALGRLAANPGLRVLRLSPAFGLPKKALDDLRAARPGLAVEVKQ